MSLQPRETERCGKKSCCCKCKHQIRLHICLCGKCPSVVGGYVCDGITEENNDRVGSYMGMQRHGECELYSQIEPKEGGER